MKTTTTTTKFPTAPAADVNWQARYYREKNQAFYNSSSYSAPTEPIAISMGKREKKALVKAGLVAVSKVRHNKPVIPAATMSKYVVIGGVPHKRVNGKYIPLVAAAKSKKWTIVEPKKTKKAPAKKALVMRARAKK